MTTAFEVGDSVSVTGGIPRSWGQPLAVIRSLGPVAARVQSYYDGTERRVGYEHLHPQPHVGRRRWVIVACGAAKVDRPAPAGEMYTGSWHRLARRAAEALTPNDFHILILSAKYGILRLDDQIEPYDLRLGDPGSISAAELAAQADERNMGVLHPLVVLAPKAYTALARQVWPYVEAPLEGCRGIGEQRHVLSRIATTGRTGMETP